MVRKILVVVIGAVTMSGAYLPTAKLIADGGIRWY
jgi:hypothetical protein